MHPRSAHPHYHAGMKERGTRRPLASEGCSTQSLNQASSARRSERSPLRRRVMRGATGSVRFIFTGELRGGGSRRVARVSCDGTSLLWGTASGVAPVPGSAWGREGGRERDS